MRAAETVTYLSRGRGRIAVSAVGAGSPTIVVVPGVFAHVDQTWEDKEFTRWVNTLADASRVVLYDPAGLGTSDPVVVEDDVDELEELIDWCADEVVLVSWFGGEGIATAAASRDRVSGVVLVAPLATAQLEGVLDGWGTGAVGARLCPSRKRDTEWWRRLETATATPGAIGRLDRRLRFGVTGLSPKPMLVILPTRSAVSARVGETGSGEVATHFVDSADVIPWGDSAADIARAITAFAVGGRASRPAIRERVLAAVMVTDIVGSTEQALATTGREWKFRLEAHDAVVRARVEAAGGKFGRHTGDGSISCFARVSDALKCATEVSAEAARVGLPARVGIHVGEFDLVGAVPAGVVVRVAEAVASAGGAGDIVLSAAAREAVAGLRIQAESLGERDLPTGRMSLFRLAGEPPDA